MFAKDLRSNDWMRNIWIVDWFSISISCMICSRHCLFQWLSGCYIVSYLVINCEMMNSSWWKYRCILYLNHWWVLLLCLHHFPRLLANIYTGYRYMVGNSFTTRLDMKSKWKVWPVCVYCACVWERVCHNQYRICCWTFHKIIE